MVASKAEARGMIWQDDSAGLLSEVRLEEMLRVVAQRTDLPESAPAEGAPA